MDGTESRTFSVSEISGILKSAFENPAFRDLSVYGEIYSLRLGKFSYLEIGDEGKKQTNSPVLKVAFATYYGQDYGLEDLQVGDVVLVRGSLSYYEHGSSVTLWGRQATLLSSQSGKTLLAKKKTLMMLEKKGYLDPSRKRPIPRFVRKVAILTAEGGAAYQDILKTLHGRFPVDTVLYPVQVQGSSAALSLLRAMEKAKKSDADVILIGRGGGSKTDLSAFDDEKLALSIATSPIPVITSIGHTIDTAIADRVSDKAAITPTEGASLINPSLDEIHQERESLERSLKEAFLGHLREAILAQESRKRLFQELSPVKRVESERKDVANRRLLLEGKFASLLGAKREELLSLHRSLPLALREELTRKRGELSLLHARLEGYSPEALVQSGYALLFQDGRKVRSAKELRKGKAVVTYPDGRRDVLVLGKEGEDGKDQ